MKIILKDDNNTIITNNDGCFMQKITCFDCSKQESFYTIKVNKMELVYYGNKNVERSEEDYYKLIEAGFKTPPADSFYHSNYSEYYEYN